VTKQANPTSPARTFLLVCIWTW